MDLYCHEKPKNFESEKCCLYFPRDEEMLKDEAKPSSLSIFCIDSPQNCPPRSPL
jgi:hypothetical protein